MPDKDDKLPARITGNGSDRAPVALPFRLRETLALPIGWPPDVAPNQVIASAHINQIRTSVAQWPADVDGMNHWLRNVHLENVTGVMPDPTTTAGDLITRNVTSVTRFPAGTQGQVLTVDTAQATKLRWVTPAPVVASVFGRTGVVVSQAGDYTAAQVTNAVSLLGSYANPAWITTLDWSKIINPPATYTPAAHTHDASAVVSGRFNTARLGAGLADETVYLRGDGTWAVVVGSGGGGGGGNVITVFGRIGNVIAQTGDYTAAQVSGAVVDPTIALGDLMVRSGSTVARLPAGANGQVLQSDNTQPTGLKWITMGGGAAIPGALNDGDTLQWKAGSWQVLAVGAVGQVLTVDTAGGLKWSVGAGGSQTPWLQDVDGGNHALTNVQTIVSNGAIRSISGGIIFPDGSTQVSASGQSPWNVDINANAHTLSNVGRAPAAALGSIGNALQLGITDGGNGISLEMQTWRVVAASGHGSIEYRMQRRVDATLQCYVAWGTNYLLMGSPQSPAMRIDGTVGSAYFYQNTEVDINKGYCGNLHYDGTSLRYIGNGSGFQWQPESGRSVLYTSVSGTAGAVATSVARMIFGDDGSTIITGQQLAAHSATDTILQSSTGGAVQSARVRLISGRGDEWDLVAAGSALSGTAAFRIVKGGWTNAPAIEISSTNYVGIGGVPPGFMLDVNGAMRLRTTGSGAIAWFDGATQPARAALGMKETGNNLFRLYSSATAVDIFTVDLTNNGIGINMPNPAVKLHVHGGAESSDVIRVSGADPNKFMTLSANATQGIIQLWKGDGFGDLVFNAARYILTNLPNANPGAGTKALWYDPADGNRVKFAA